MTERKRKAAVPNDKPTSAGHRIFTAASDLFYREGIRAVGVEAIAQEAGVAKISLYRNFPSKDSLIVAYLEERGADYWRLWDEVLAQHRGDPKGQFLGIMRFIAEAASVPGYRGCPFLNCAVEFPDKKHPAHKLSVAAKRELRGRILSLVKGLGVRNAESKADGVLLLVEGVVAISQILTGSESPARSLVSAAEAIVME